MIGNCYIVMWILIISLVLLGVIALIAGIIRNKRLQKKIEKGELDRMPEVKEVDVECCGQHEVCERDSLLAAVSKKIEYYDDEELDQFIGKAGDAYTEEETEMFRDVLYTTLDVEVAGWVRSLQLRGIELPDDLKDEVFLIIGERRAPAFMLRLRPETDGQLPFTESLSLTVSKLTWFRWRRWT